MTSSKSVYILLSVVLTGEIKRFAQMVSKIRLEFQGPELTSSGGFSGLRGNEWVGVRDMVMSDLEGGSGRTFFPGP